MKRNISLLFILSLLSINLIAQEDGWFSPCDPPTNYSINDIYFVDSSTGWIVGYDGEIFKTTDGGSQWDEQYSTNVFIFYDVFFINESTGWAVGRHDLMGYIALVYTTSNGGANWQPHQTGIGGNLYSLSFVNSSTGWVVGVGGKILKTTHGGSDWTEQSSGTTNNLRSVHFVDSQTGWAVGDGGTILKTADGGTNWLTQSSGISFDLLSVHFVNNQIGWAVGEWGTIVNTIDGGTNWSSQQSGISNHLQKVQFTDELTGWAVGEDGVILKSNDGGTSWFVQSSLTTNNLNALHFVDDNTGWAVGSNGQVIKTTDGGGSTFPTPTLTSPSDGSVDISVDPTLDWNPAENATSYRIQVSLDQDFSNTVHDVSGITNTSYQISNLTDNTTYYWRVNALYGNGPGVWTPVWSFTTIEEEPPPVFLAPQLKWPPVESINITVNPTLEWFECENAISYHLQVNAYTPHFGALIDIDQSNITETFFNASDLSHNRLYYWRVKAIYYGGESDWSSIWSFTTAPYVPSSPELFSPYDDKDLLSINPVLQWFGDWRSETYKLQVSKDSTFSELVYDDSTITDKEQQIGPLDFFTTYYWRVSAKNGGGTSQYSEIWRFTTESEAWHPQESNTWHGLLSIVFIDPHTGWIASDYGTILKTTDGGETWIERETVTTKDFNSIYFINDQIGWVVGNDGIILMTDDGGESWEPQESHTEEDILSVNFIDALKGWAVGWGGTILKTTDGGINWVDHSIEPYDQFLLLHSVQFIDSNTGWAVGPYIFKTTDGGISWVKYDTIIGMYSVQFIDPYKGWVVGSKGKIFKTTDGGITWNAQTSRTENTLNDVHFVDELNGLVVGDDGIILKTIDGGNNWKESNSGIQRSYYCPLNSIYFIDAYTGWAIGCDGIILKTTTGGSTSIEDINISRNSIPDEFTLLQNYPNPFNPNTTISYSIHKPNFVNLKIYDVLGRKIQTLVTEFQTKGNYSFNFDASKLSSGVYFYKLQVGNDFIETKKMLLMR